MQRRTVVRDVVHYRAAIRAGELDQRRWPNLHLLQAMRRRAIVLEVASYSAVASACERGASMPEVIEHCADPVRAREGAGITRRPCPSYERCGALPSCRICSSIVQPQRVRGKGPAASAGLHFLRAMRRQAAVPVVVIYRAAVSGLGRASSTSMPHASSKCDAAPFHRAGGGYLRCGPQRVRKLPAAPAGLASLPCEAAPGRNAGCVNLQCCRPHVREGQQHR